MKLSVEIKDDKFIYDYEVGTSKQHGNINLDAQKYIIFCELLNRCHFAACADYKIFKDEIAAKCYMENHPKEAVEYLKKLLNNARK